MINRISSTGYACACVIVMCFMCNCSSDNAREHSQSELAARSTELLKLQQKADILFECKTWDTMVLRRSKIPNNIPENGFPLSELSKYFPSGFKKSRGTCVVIIVPQTFGINVDRPSLRDTLRNIKAVLTDNGVKSVMFQTNEWMLWNEVVP